MKEESILSKDDTLVNEAANFDASLTEASTDDLINSVHSRDIVVSKREENLKKLLVIMLANKSGKYGPEKHVSYARILDKLIVKIVSLKADPNYTASISFNENILRIGEGLIVDKDKMYQLPSVVRHEIAHNILMHEIRMIAKINDKVLSDHLMRSRSVFSLFNIIADFEISNEKYSARDKEIFRNLYINSKIVHCLVTEDHRESWQNLSLEEMYDALLKEETSINLHLNHNVYYSDVNSKLDGKDEVTYNVANALNKYNKYAVTNSVFWLPLNEFFKRSNRFRSYSEDHQKMIKNIYDAILNYYDVTEDDIVNYSPEASDNVKMCIRCINHNIMLMSESRINREYKFRLYDYTTDKYTELALSDEQRIISPEEKYLVLQLLLALNGHASDKPVVHVTRADKKSKEYIDAYNHIIKSCGKKDVSEIFTDEVLRDILSKFDA